MVKTYFHVVLLWSILVYKIPQFWAKATDPDSHPELTKTPSYVLFPKGSQKKVSPPGLLI